MCGIIGCNGVEGASGKIIEGLERLEYRGYDSAGIATIEESGIKYIKKKGRVRELVKEIEAFGNIGGTVGIGHTRWATHGAPSDKNAHPHISGKFAVVHNGIIENYSSLREQYLKLANILSDTDTEIIAQLINRLYNGNCLETIAQVAGLLEGSFALAILCEDKPDKLYCVRKASPLLVGAGEKGYYAASDTGAINDKIHTLYRMDDGEIAVLNKDSVEFYNFELDCISKAPCEFERSESAISKDSFEHFMIKEIYEQPDAIRKTVNAYLNGNEMRLGFDLSLPERFCIVACGSAYHAGIVGKRVLEELLQIPVSVEIASEFRYGNPLVSEQTLVIVISQSGETADSLAALREAKKRGAKTLSIVNVLQSSIAVESDFVMYTKAGAEVAVATTKAYSAQLAALYLLGIYFFEKVPSADKNFSDLLKNDLNRLHSFVRAALNCEEYIKEIALQLKDINTAYFIGRGLGYAAAAEGSLKLKEISYIHCEAYAAGEMKHGTISLIETGTPVFAMDVQSDLTHKLQSNIDEVRARGARVIAISSDNGINADTVVRVPRVNPLFSVSTQIVPVQLLSYHIARLRGCDIDKPRNLAKSVTVE